MSLCFELCDIFCFIVSLLYFLFSSDFVFVRVQGSFCQILGFQITVPWIIII